MLEDQSRRICYKRNKKALLDARMKRMHRSLDLLYQKCAKDAAQEAFLYWPLIFGKKGVSYNCELNLLPLEFCTCILRMPFILSTGKTPYLERKYFLGYLTTQK